MKKKISPEYKQSLVKVKNWTLHNSPSSIKPILSHALDMATAFQTGFGHKAHEFNDERMELDFSYDIRNLDFLNQLSTGLITNAALKMVFKHLEKQGLFLNWTILHYNVQLTTFQSLNEDLKLISTLLLSDLETWILNNELKNEAYLTTEVFGLNQKQDKVLKIEFNFILSKNLKLQTNDPRHSL